MTYLLWSIGVILFLALVNAVASWFGLDVATAGEEPHEPAHGHSAALPAPAPARHAPAATHTTSHH